MSDNLNAEKISSSAYDLPNQNNNPPNPWDTPQTPIPEPSDTLNPPNIPNSTNNIDPVQSWVAQHEARDAHGHFVKSDHLTNGSSYNSQTTPIPQTPPNPSSSSNLPPPISITENTKYSEKHDPPMVNLQVTNPVTYFKKWVTKFFKNQDIDLHLRIKPFATIGLVLAFTVVGGSAFSIGRNFFPNSSPIFHRAITLQGTIQRSESGQFYLVLPDNTLWTLRPKANNINLSNVVNKSVLVKGNLTAEANVVNVSEVISFGRQPSVYSYPPASSSAQNYP